MSLNESHGESTKFSEILESKIEAKEGAFAQPHPFLRTAVRGLASRLNDETVPMGFVLATELYIYDVDKGVDGFSGKPMPADVLGLPPFAAGAMIRMTATDVAREAFGDDFADQVQEFRRTVNGQ